MSNRPCHVNDRNTNLAIVERPVDHLHDNPRNARTHDAAQIKMIADSIRTFGFNNPVLIDDKDQVIAGHGRLAAARQLGWTVVPTIRLDHMTDAEVRAYTIADNRLAELAGWDEEVLAIELQHLLAIEANFDLNVTGFSGPEIDLKIQSLSADDLPGQELIDFEPSTPAVSQEGDIWQLGAHRLACGNSLRTDVVERLMAGDKARMAFTDPPYNVPIQGHVVANKNNARHSEFAMAAGEMTKAQFTAFLSEALAILSRQSRDGALSYVCMDWRHIHDLLSAGHQGELELKNICVWNKSNGGMGSLYRSKHEFVAVYKHGSGAHVNNIELGRHGRNRTNVWDYPGASSFGSDCNDRHGDHPTVKPVALIADAILDASQRGDIVLDTFAGSGSTILAAERTGRACHAVELEPKYVDCAIRRWQRETGRDAHLDANGLSFDKVSNLRHDAVAAPGPVRKG